MQQDTHIITFAQSIPVILGGLGLVFAFVGFVFKRYVERNDSDHNLAREKFDLGEKRFDEITREIVEIKTEHNMNHGKKK